MWAAPRTPTSRMGMSPTTQADSIREMQRQLAETNAAVRVLHEQRRDELNSRLQRASMRAPSLSGAGGRKGGGGGGVGGLSQLWYEDDMERQAAQHRRSHQHFATHQPRRGDGRGFAGGGRVHDSDVNGMVELNHRLHAELQEVRESKTVLESEALAFKVRMETAVNSFEGIIEQAVAEKSKMFEQLVAAKDQLAAAHQELGERGRRSPSSIQGMEAERTEAGTLLKVRAAHAAEVERLGETARRLEAELSAKTDEMREQRDSLRQQLQQAAAESERTRASVKAEMAANQEEHAGELRAAEERLSATRSEASSREAELEKQVRTAERRAAEHAAARSDSSQRISELESQARASEASAARWLASLSEKSERIGELERALDQAGGASAERLRSAEAQLAEVKARAAQLEAQLLGERAAAESDFRARLEEAKADGVRRAKALEAELDAARSEAADRLARLEEEYGEALQRNAALQEASRSATQTTSRLDSELSAAQLALEEMEASREGAAQVPNAKVDALGRMLQDQQQELRESYRFSAACKLQLAIGGRGMLSMALALLAWRHACKLQLAGEESAHALTAKSSDTGEERRLASRVSELEAQLEAAEGQAVRFAAEMASKLAAAQREGSSLAEQAEASQQKASHRATSLAEQLRAARAELDEARESIAELQRDQQQARADTGSGLPPAKVDALGRMLREQQQELCEGYRFSAACKLQLAIGARDVVSLALALFAWRHACKLQLAGEESALALAAASSGAGEKERRLASRVSELEAQLEAAEGQAMQVAAEMASKLEGAQREASSLAGQAAASQQKASHRVTSLEEQLRAARAELNEAHESIAELQRNQHQAGADAGSGLPPAKVDALGRMLREQQQELCEGYRFSAACKLQLAIGERDVVSLALALFAWRHACRLQLAGEESAHALAASSRAGPEVSTLQLRVSELEAELHATRQEASSSASRFQDQLSAAHVAASQRASLLEEEAQAARREAVQRDAELQTALSTLDELRSRDQEVHPSPHRVANGDIPHAKVEALERMLREQQQELSDGYRFSAACKLYLAIGRRGVASLALALAAWREACKLTLADEEAARALVAASSASWEEGRRLSARVLELETQLEDALRPSANVAAQLHQARPAAETAQGDFSRQKVAAPDKVEALTRMLQEQQEELHEGYLFSAACKLHLAIGRRSVVSLARALTLWRQSCKLLLVEGQVEDSVRSATKLQERLHVLEAECRKVTKENRAMAISLRSLEAQITSTRTAVAESSTTSSVPAIQRVASKPPLSPTPSAQWLPSTDSSLTCGKSLASTSLSSSSPAGAALAESLGGAIAAAKSRPTSPKLTLAEQLHQAVAARSTRTQGEENTPAPEPAFCTFCGLEADTRNVVRCCQCYAVAYHIRCLSSAQAERFKGRRWFCDDCLTKQKGGHPPGGANQ